MAGGASAGASALLLGAGGGAAPQTATRLGAPTAISSTRPAGVRPRALQPGDRVWITSPAGTPDAGRLDRCVDALRSWGLEVEPAPHLHDRYGYLGGTDADRLADLNAGLADPTVRAVMASAGGYGTQRIVDGVDTSAVARDPKLVIGFSDLTALELALWQRAGLVTVYGPVAAWPDRLGDTSAEALRAALMTTDLIVLRRDPEEASAAVQVDGRATGLVLGGNLSMLASTLGTDDFPDLAGAILFVEDIGEPPYRIDRMLTTLVRSGRLDGVAGVALGQFTDCVGRPGTWTVAEVLTDRLGGLGVPVLGGLPVGHGAGQLTLPLGVPAILDTEAGTLIVEPAVG